MVFEPALDRLDLRLESVLARFQRSEFFGVLCLLSVSTPFGCVECFLACVLELLGVSVSGILSVLVDPLDLVMNIGQFLVQRRSLLEVRGDPDRSQNDLPLLLEDAPVVSLCCSRECLG